MSRLDELRNHYLFARARIIASDKVIMALENALQENTLFAEADVQALRAVYEARLAEARAHMHSLAESAPALVDGLRLEHLEDGLLKAKERELEEIIAEGAVAPKAALKLQERIAIHRAHREG